MAKGSIPELRVATHVIGVDEVGYGAIAGPLVIGGAIVPIRWVPPDILTDSKDLLPEQIDALALDFHEAVRVGTPGLYYELTTYTSEEIDRMGAGNCRYAGLAWMVRQLLRQCLSLFPGSNPVAVVDGNSNIPNAVNLVKADAKIPACSMASVVAKHSRDAYMRADAERLYPGYGFADHVGYDVPAHRDALGRLGPCAIHRTSYSTVQRYRREVNLLDELFPDD